jgi:putrescine transport system permease protein
MTSRLSPFLATMLVVGLVFLYGPILSVVVYSFNASRLVTVWAGFSTHWYGELLRNAQIRAAALVSLEVALMAATGALVLGTLAGFALARYRSFRGRAVFGTLVTAPLVTPEVITGLSLLLLFVALEQALGWPGERGILTIAIAHITLGSAYVAVVVEARLAAFDRALEEAALDLGAPPVKVFLVITLPLIAPALIASWLLAFTLSLDDLVIASFTSGPASTTLPMVIFSSVRLGVSPQINALATLFVVSVALLVTLASRLISGFERAPARPGDPAPGGLPASPRPGARPDRRPGLDLQDR